MLPLQHYCSTCGAAYTDADQFCATCQQTFDTVDDASIPAGLVHERYRIIERVGTGGFGAVYRAEDTLVRKRFVAIKQIHLRGLTAQQMIDATDTFNREVELLSDLKHPHLPRVYDRFQDTGHWYVVMDFIQGETLEVYLTARGSSPAQQACSFETVLDMGLQLCSVLSYLHSQHPPIIFRDLKPENVMRTASGKLYLIDFGIARRFKPGQRKDTIPLGSPGYAAPEQYGSAQTTPQSDLYSLGALLHRLLTGKEPGRDAFSPVQGYSNTGQRELQALLQRLTERDISKRPQSAQVVDQELQEIALRNLPAESDLKQRLHEERAVRTGTKRPAWTPPPLNSNISASSGFGQQQQMQQQRQRLSASRARSANRGRRNMLAMLGVAGVACLAGAWLHTGTSQPDRISEPPNHPSLPADAHRQTLYQGHTGIVFFAQWSPDGQYIASADTSSVKVWEVATQKTLWSYSTPSGCIGLSWSSDGKHISLALNEILSENDFLVLDAANGTTIGGYRKDLSQIPVVGKYEASIVWSPDGKLVAIPGLDTTIQICNATTGDVISTCTKRERGYANVLSWSPDSMRLIASDSSGGRTIWEASSGKVALVYANGPQTLLDTATWSPDGKYIAAPNPAGDWVQIRDATTGQVVYLYTGTDHLTSDYSPLLALAWSPNGQRLAAAFGSPNASIHIWDALTGAHPFIYRGHSDSVYTLAWSPDGQTLVSAGADTTVQVWRPA